MLQWRAARFAALRYEASLWGTSAACKNKPSGLFEGPQGEGAIGQV